MVTSQQVEEQKDIKESNEVGNISQRLVTAKFGSNSKDDEEELNNPYLSFSNNKNLMNTEEKIFEDSFELNSSKV